ncbi:MAG: HDIG domain-containing protein [Thermoplasmatales archaeon]|nr:HDIG domain-containing protein [Thermoplasmatales archaeon]
MKVIVYRYGHRIERDKRMTTHVALAARAFGADGIFVDRKDEELEKRIRKVIERFGGNFFIESGIDWKKLIKEWNGKIIHLTMYGEKIENVIEEIKKFENILVIVGSEKVPGEFYEISDYNVAIGNQPHSEVSSIAIFLHMLNGGEWMKRNFGGVIKIIPSKKGKKLSYNYLKILEKEGCSKDVIEHCKKVRDLAIKIAEKIAENGINLDMEAIEAGAILHDVGRAKRNDLMHVVEGVKIAKKYGLPKKVVAIIERHVGSGIDEEDAERLGLPKKDYIPKSIEEEIVSHADNLTSNGYRNIEEAINEFKKFGDKQVKKLIETHEKLSKFAGLDIDRIVDGLKPSK